MTLDRVQSKMLLTIDKHRTKITRNSVFNCHLSPVWHQMAIKNSVSNYFYLCSSTAFMFLIAAYPVWYQVVYSFCFYDNESKPTTAFLLWNFESRAVFPIRILTLPITHSVCYRGVLTLKKTPYDSQQGIS